MSDLLPPNATAAERALSETVVRAAEVSVPISDLWRPDNCPVSVLPWLAWALSVDEWDSGWDEAVKREVIARSIAIHRRKGTVWAVRQALIAAGYADAEISEGLPHLTYDGSQLHDSGETYAGGTRWALFDILVDIGENEGISAAKINLLKRLVSMAKPVSRHLREVTFQSTLSDEIAMTETAGMSGGATLAEEAYFGRCYNGAIDHDQAVAVDGYDAILFDGAWRYGGEQLYSGESKYSRWEITGECYDNVRCRMELAPAGIAVADGYVARDLTHGGAAVHDGAAVYGAAGDRPTDAMTFVLTRLVKHNGRHTYGDGRLYAPRFFEALTA